LTETVDPEEGAIERTFVGRPGGRQRADEFRVTFRENALAVPNAVLKIEIAESRRCKTSLLRSRNPSEREGALEPGRIVYSFYGRSGPEIALPFTCGCMVPALIGRTHIPMYGEISCCSLAVLYLDTYNKASLLNISDCRGA
jgi:hypothetical protein